MESPGKGPRSAVRILLGVLLGVVALNAGAGGYYALSGAENVPVEWLDSSPFSSYTVPGLILLVLVGGSAAVGAVAVFAQARTARLAALAAGLVLLVWILVQVSIIGYVSWLQPTMAAAAITILALALALPEPSSRATRRERTGAVRSGRE